MHSDDKRDWVAGRLRVVVEGSIEEMAARAAAEVGDYLRGVLAAQPEARVIFASAASQVLFLDRLVEQCGVDWSRVVCFHMDEYLGVDPTHPASFRLFLQQRLVDRVKPRAFHTVMGEADEPLKECERYAGLLGEAPVDLCVLGIGENGHVAFNDPPVADFGDMRLVKLVKLDEACRMQQVGEGAFATLEQVPRFAYTLTVPALCGAKRMACVVPEKRKAVAVRDALRGPIETRCPASILREQSHATLYLDPDSASLL
ncbi:MAG: glucosamine-6-phosphate deaminase 1 [Verrucomicrobiota bacterium]|jgi:glucosamine-6-phosphate deaminase